MKATWNKKYTLFVEYVYNYRCQLEEDIHQIQMKIRFRKPTIEDCIELIIAQNRLETFLEVTNHVKHIFNLECITNKRNDL